MFLHQYETTNFATHDSPKKAKKGPKIVRLETRLSGYAGAVVDHVVSELGFFAHADADGILSHVWGGGGGGRLTGVGAWGGCPAVDT